MAEEGTIAVRGFNLPPSYALSAETRAAVNWQARQAEVVARMHPFTHTTFERADETIAFRTVYDKYYLPHLIARQEARYDVTIRTESIAGVATEVFVPTAGVSTTNGRLVLINLHGGNFIFGSRCAGQVESIPIAAVGEIKVVSVDYRMAPEHRFPAATEDVLEVYRELLNDHAPESIAIYGSSAGALLTAQAVAALDKQGLPRPAAIGLFCAGGSFFGEGDSGHSYAARSGLDLAQVVDPHLNPHLKDVDPADPAVFPVRSPELLARFPPVLLFSGTRDMALSSVVHTHSILVEQDICADLHVWEGLDHVFYYSPDLAESRRAYALAAKFFAKHLKA